MLTLAGVALLCAVSEEGGHHREHLGLVLACGQMALWAETGQLVAGWLPWTARPAPGRALLGGAGAVALLCVAVRSSVVVVLIPAAIALGAACTLLLRPEPEPFPVSVVLLCHDPQHVSVLEAAWCVAAIGAAIIRGLGA